MVEPGYEIQKADVVQTIIGSRKISTTFLELSKLKLYLLLHVIVIGSIFLYQSIWLFSKTTMANCYAFNAEQLLRRGANPGTLVYQFTVNGTLYTETCSRNETPLAQQSIRVRYLPFAPDWSRLDTYEGNWAGFVIGWFVFFVISSMIFFIPNETMPRNSFFYFSSSKPFIHMIVK